MIRINLLPHREAARKRRKDTFNVTLLIACLVGVAMAALLYSWIQTEISAQEDANQLLVAEVQKFETQIKDIAKLETEINALRARQQAVEDLQADRNLPAHLMKELVQLLPDGIYVSKLVQVDQSVTLSGVAQSNERVSELLHSLSNKAAWFTKPELIEIVASSVALSAREQKRVYNFTMRVGLVRGSTPPPAKKP